MMTAHEHQQGVCWHIAPSMLSNRIFCQPSVLFCFFFPLGEWCHMPGREQGGQSRKTVERVFCFVGPL